METWVYILRSESSGRYYCGQTTEVERRVRQHSDPEYRLSQTTKRFDGPWMLIWSQVCEEQERISVIILDLTMPGIGGKDCLKGLLKINPKAKVIVASGYSSDISVQDCVQLWCKELRG
jgi:putative endonuclease